MISEGSESQGYRTTNRLAERYSGVCDVIDPLQARAMADELRLHRRDPNRKVMIGVMAGPFSLRPEISGPDAEEERSVFPTRDEMSLGFTDDPDVVNTVHYADLYRPEEVITRDLPESLEMIVEHGGEHLHAIQLDVTWPSVEVLDAFKDAHPEIKIVLQLGAEALKRANNDPETVVEMVDKYGDSVDYALLDMSMGKGKGLEAGGLLPMLRTLRRELPGLGLAVAGGLGPESVDLLEPIVKEFPDISIDAQGRLKPPGSPVDAYGHLVSTVPADLERSAQYIQRSAMLLDNPTATQTPI